MISFSDGVIIIGGTFWNLTNQPKKGLSFENYTLTPECLTYLSNQTIDLSQ